jgi:hypothetical protein
MTVECRTRLLPHDSGKALDWRVTTPADRDSGTTCRLQGWHRSRLNLKADRTKETSSITDNSVGHGNARNTLMEFDVRDEKLFGRELPKDSPIFRCVVPTRQSIHW